MRHQTLPEPPAPGSTVGRALEALAHFHPRSRAEAYALLRMYRRRHELTAADIRRVVDHYPPSVDPSLAAEAERVIATVREPEVRKIGYAAPVNVVDGVPQCPCHQEPMVEHGDGWMCATGSAVLDALAPMAARLDAAIRDGSDR